MLSWFSHYESWVLAFEMKCDNYSFDLGHWLRDLRAYLCNKLRIFARESDAIGEVLAVLCHTHSIVRMVCVNEFPSENLM